jgi:two-component system, NtrC family, sensor kinase
LSGHSLFRKYAGVFVILVGGALLASGLVQLYFSYQESQTALVELEREKAVTAATRIEQFVAETERVLNGVTEAPLIGAPRSAEQWRDDYLRLLRQAPAVTELSHLDSSGREQVRVSRLAINVIGGQTDFSGDPKFVQARQRHTYFGPVYFRSESEPYMTISLPRALGVSVERG